MLGLPDVAAFRVSERTLPEGDALGRLAQVLTSPGFPEAGVPAEGLLDEVERRLIVKASEASGWNQTRTAALLAMKRDRLRYRMKLFGLAARPDREAA